MGLSFRKSIKAGPFKFNLSGSGIGVSVGVPGFRIGTGPRGNYISMSAGGFTYRKSLSTTSHQGTTLGEPSKVPAVEAEPHQGQRFIPSGSATVAPLEVIQSADVRMLSDSDSAELVDEINSKRSKLALWYWPLVLLGIVWWFVLAAGNDPSVFLLGALAALSTLVAVSTFWLYMWDEARRSTVLFYDFDGHAESIYENVLSAFSALQNSRASWRILASGRVLDGRYNAGAGQTVKRKTAALGKGGVSHVRSNIDVPWLNAGRNSFYFYPDKVFIMSGSHVAVCNYGSMDLSTKLTRFIEEDQVPSDSKIVGHTWRFVNKNGTPDRRFNNNRQIPIAQYEEMRMSSPQGVQECFQFSHAGTAEAFVNTLLRLGNYQMSSAKA